MLKGVSKIKERAKEAQSMSGKNRIRWLNIGDGEVALLRFVTDKDDIIQAEMHSVKRMTPRGERFSKTYCKSQDNMACEYCAQGISTGPMLFAWVYVYEIMHRQQNQRLTTDPNAAKWERIEVRDIPYFKEEVEGLMVFKTGPGKDQKYRNMLVNLSEEYGTLSDRDYKWVRTGSTKETTDYSLVPRDPKKTKKEVIEASKDLPDLGDVISGKIKSLGQEAQEGFENSVQNPTEDELDSLF